MTNVYRDAQTNRCFITHTVKQTDRQTDVLLHIRWNRQTDKQMFYYTYSETDRQTNRCFITHTVKPQKSLFQQCVYICLNGHLIISV